MQLLHASPTPEPEFVAISLLMNQDQRSSSSSSIGEPLFIVSPLATISDGAALEAMKELHAYLSVSLKATSAPKKLPSKDKMAVEFLQEDAKLLTGVQIFRPKSANGMGLHFRLIRSDTNAISSLSSLVMLSNKNGGSMEAPAGLVGVVVCVGFSGLPFAHSVCSIHYSLSQRLNDCVGVLKRLNTKDVASAKSLLSGFLVTEDEYRKTNEMTEAIDLLTLPEVDESKGIRPRRMSAITKGPAPNGATPTVSGVMMSAGEGSGALASSMFAKLNVLSVAETDTFLRRYEISGAERKANLDLTRGSKARQRRRKSNARDADFDNFDYKGPVREAVVRQATQALGAADPSGRPALRQSTRDTTRKVQVPTISASRSDAVTNPRRMSNHSGLPGNDSNSRRASLDRRGRRGSAQSMYDDDASEGTRGQSLQDSSAASLARVQVNIALNEDLSCSYRQSQLSSCNVEGVVQVQVKSNSRASVPFFLLIRDPSMHIGTLKENGKFAADASDELVQDQEEDVADRKFAVSVPKGDSYFPVLKYKCSGDLRPVPLRVQTKVKTDGASCRVALQISSNPNNAASLTDLTIIMNVPDGVRGETLATQPTGGIWDESKKSVVWLVSELGDGEKFQLQARFDMNAVATDEPSFPVLVRCQCLFAQLSDIELEVRDIPEVYPAEMAMKVARRFRLYHRERS